MSFLDDIFAQLEAAGGNPLVQELRDGKTASVSGRELLQMVGEARAFLVARKIPQGERCALLAHNSIRWVAMDLAIMAEGLIVVPLYARQAAAELVSMMKDCSPVLICCGDAGLRDGIVQNWTAAPSQVLLDDVFGGPAPSNSRAGA